MRTWKRSVAAVLAASVVVGGSAMADAAPGDVDADFGTAGVVSGLPGFAEDVIVSDDRIVALSETTTGLNTSTLHVRVLTHQGDPDTTFSGDGALDIDAALSVTTGHLAVDGSGRILVAVGGTSGGAIGQQVYRITAAGALDPSFSGDGVQTFDNKGLFSMVNGIGVQPDGDIIVGLNDANAFGGLSQFPQLVRLDPSGTKKQTVDVLGGYVDYGSLASMVVDGSGRPHVLLPVEGKLAVRRYTEALTLDPTFSGDGIASIGRPGGADDDNRGGALAVDDTGKVLVAGTVAKRTEVMAGPPVVVENATLVGRLTSTGAADTTLSGDGVATVARPAGMVSPLAVGPTALGGVVVLADRSQEGGGATDGLVWELTAAGAASTGFSTDGRIELGDGPIAGTTFAGGTRLLDYSVAGDATSGSLRSIELSAPTAPVAPAAPTLVGGSATSVTLSLVIPANGGSPIASVTVKAFAGSDTTTAMAEASVPVPGAAPGTAAAVTVTGLTPGVRYRFRATATNGVGTGPSSALSGYALPPFSTVDRFVKQQYLDFIGRQPSAAELADLRNRIQVGTTSPVVAIDEVAAKPEWATLDPLTRIYYAYFGRSPDKGGLSYWLGKRRSGTKVSAISNQFAASNEFKNKYGSLTNRAFVELVYQNVLGRPGDSAGIASWTKKLDTKTRTRGEVMVQFSESGEHQRRRAGEVNTVSVIFGLLKRAPTSAELTTWAPQVKASRQPLIGSVLASAAYDARIPSA